MTGMQLGISCGTDLTTIYANLLSDAANALSVSSNGTRTLVLMAGQIQSAAFRQGAAQGESLQEIQNNASALANIGNYCQIHDIFVTVNAILTPPVAAAFYPNGGSPTVANEYVNAWATAAAAAGLPIGAVLDIQEAATESATNQYGVTTEALASMAASEALAVNTLINTYKQFSIDAESQNIQRLNADAGLTQGQTLVTATGLSLSDQLTLISNSYANAAANLIVGDMEAGGGSFTNAILMDAAEFWNDYDSIANSGTVELYGSWSNNGGKLTQSSGNLTTADPASEIPNATTIWSQGTVLNVSAFSSIINPGTITRTGSGYSWTASSDTLPSNWVPLAGTTATPLYEILQSGTVYTYVYEQPAALTLNGAQKHFSFVTSDTGAGADWQEWLQGLKTLASGGTIYSSGTSISIGSNPTLAFDVMTEPFGIAISDAQVVQQAEHQAAMLGSFGINIDDLVNEAWSYVPLGTGPVFSPSSWTNAEAEIAATYPLYMAHLITADGSSGLALTTPGQLVINTGTAEALGNLSLSYDFPNSQQARFAVVVLDLNGRLSLTNQVSTGGSGTFGSSGIFSGAGSNMLVLDGDVADLAQALRAISVTEAHSGPDTIDIEVFGINGQVSDDAISVFATNGPMTGWNVATDSQDWAMSSSTIYDGTLVAETLNWKTTMGPSDVTSASAASGVSSPSLFKNDLVLATFVKYDVLVSSTGILSNGTSLISNVYNSHDDPLFMPYAAGLNLVSQMASLTVQSTTNLFDAAGYLVQSTDILAAPIAVNGIDGSTLAQWGKQVTYYHVPGDGTTWNFGSQCALVQLTLSENGQTIQAIFQENSSDSADTLYQIFNPNHPDELWEEIRTTTALCGAGPSAANLQAVVTEFNTGDNPFWDSYSWGTTLGSIADEIWCNGGSIYGKGGSTIGNNGTSEVINLPNGGAVLGSPNASNIVNGNSVAVWMSKNDTVAVTGDNVTVTGGPGSTVSLGGDSDVAGLYPGSTVTVSGHDVVYGDSLNVLTSSATASASIRGNNNHVIAAAGSSITVVGTNDTVSLPNAAITLHASADSAVWIDDTSAGFVANLSELATWSAAGLVRGISITDSRTAAIALTSDQISANSNLLKLIRGAIIVTTAENAAAIAAMIYGSLIAVEDTAANVAAKFDVFEDLARAGKLQSISFTDTGLPDLILSENQVSGDAAAMAFIRGSFDLISGTPPTITGTVTGQAVTNVGTIAPFTNVTITNPSADQILTVTASLSAATNGVLTSLGGGTYSNANGILTIIGTATSVTAVLHDILFKPTLGKAPAGQTVTTEITIGARNAVGIYASDTTTSVVARAVSALPDEVVLSGSSSQYIVSDDNGSLFIQDTMAWRDGTRTLPGVFKMVFTDGFGLFDPTGTAEDVARLYGALLDRTPDVAGLEYWTFLIDNAMATLNQVAADFATSPEFISDYGLLSDAGFVNQLYDNVLGRAPDALGAQAWENALAWGVSRGAIALGFAESPENVAKTVSNAGSANQSEIYRFYQTSFNRVPEAYGVAYWSSLLANGVTPAQVAASFVNSAEFQLDYGALSVQDFVADLYQNALHRTPEATGLQYWASQLQQGESQADVLVGFSNSLECRVINAGATHANWAFIPA